MRGTLEQEMGFPQLCQGAHAGAHQLLRAHNRTDWTESIVSPEVAPHPAARCWPADCLDDQNIPPETVPYMHDEQLKQMLKSMDMTDVMASLVRKINDRIEETLENARRTIPGIPKVAPKDEANFWRMWNDKLHMMDRFHVDWVIPTR